MELLKQLSDNLIKRVDTRYLRYMYHQIPWGNRMTALVGPRGLGKVEKVYLDNPNLAFALSSTAPDIGNLRETFFYNQMRVNQTVFKSPISDFLIEGKTFEIGGKKKGQKQITEAAEGYVVKDDIESGFGNVIPLRAFGLNY